MIGPERAIVALMKLTGLRQIDVARELGVSRSRLASWLSGYAPMPDETLLKLHRLIGARLARLDKAGEQVVQAATEPPNDRSLLTKEPGGNE